VGRRDLSFHLSIFTHQAQKHGDPGEMSFGESSDILVTGDSAVVVDAGVSAESSFSECT
jgi:hypothetical protein